MQRNSGDPEVWLYQKSEKTAVASVENQETNQG